jgi:ABC-type polysaccharide/polyol phosphate transport system ATPase subunit
MAPAIVVENVSKHYYIRHALAKEKTDTLRETLTHLGARLWQRVGRKAGSASGAVEEFWALRDVSFEVERGEIVGVVGRNGAGKSTLLKVLSRITRPTAGRVRLLGRLTSLLEVGAGFHPELTGRENVFLNAAILGMKRNEIRRKFDEIVDFAEIGQFIDTPVKRYSSGMYVRLAFAIAAHVNADVLLVDEVLAVGDTAFQEKCQKKVQCLMSQTGVTVLLVSHSMETVNRLCQKAVLLHQGQLLYAGDLACALRRYQKSQWATRRADGTYIFPEVDWAGGRLTAPAAADTSMPFTAHRVYQVFGAPVGGNITIHYFASQRRTLGDSHDLYLGRETVTDPAAKTVGVHQGPTPPLRCGVPGRYFIIAVIDDGAAFGTTSILTAAAAGPALASAQPTEVNGPVDVIIDDGTPGYADTGLGWRTSVGPGAYGEAMRWSPVGSGTNKAIWSFADLPPGTYEVQLCWFPHPNFATNAPFEVYVGDTLVRSVRVNQQEDPVGSRLGNSHTTSVTQFRVTGGTVRVVLSNDADGWVVADAIRLLQIGP